MKKLLLICCLMVLFSIATKGIEHDSLLQAARNHLGCMNYSESLKILNTLEESDANNPEVLYMKTDVYLTYGMDKFNMYMERLSHTGNKEYTDVMSLKHLLFIGS